MRELGVRRYISQGATDPIMLIGDLSTVWLVANVRETDAPFVRVGQSVEVRVTAYPDKVFKAKLTFVAPMVDPNTHRLPIRAEVPNGEGLLKPEMWADFRIATVSAARTLRCRRGPSSSKATASGSGLPTRTIISRRAKSRQGS